MADDPRYKPCPECGQPKRQYVACEHCGYSFIAAEARKPKPAPPPVDTRPAFSPQQEPRSKPRAKVVIKSKKRRLRNESAPAVGMPQHVPQYGGKVVVYDQGREVEEEKPCASCERLVMPVWLFRESDRGLVYLCRSCKDEAVQNRG
jgi:hypothetical protein